MFTVARFIRCVDAWFVSFILLPNCELKFDVSHQCLESTCHLHAVACSISSEQWICQLSCPSLLVLVLYYICIVGSFTAYIVQSVALSAMHAFKCANFFILYVTFRPVSAFSFIVRYVHVDRKNVLETTSSIINDENLRQRFVPTKLCKFVCISVNALDIHWLQLLWCLFCCVLVYCALQRPFLLCCA